MVGLDKQLLVPMVIVFSVYEWYREALFHYFSYIKKGRGEEVVVFGGP